MGLKANITTCHSDPNVILKVEPHYSTPLSVLYDDGADTTTLCSIETSKYFGEMALLLNTPAATYTSALSTQTDVVLIDSNDIETLLLDEPKVAMKLFWKMATKLQKRNQ